MAFGTKAAPAAAREPEDPNKPKQELTPQPQSGTAVEVYDPGEDAGAGMENIGMDERRIPFLRILDPKSPQCKPVAAGGLPGAKGGAILNTSTKQVFDGEKGFDFLACFREQKYIEYIHKEEDGSGGGFVGIHEPDEPMVVQHRAYYGKFGKMPVLSEAELAACMRDPKRVPQPLLDDKNKAHELVQTFSLYGVVLMPDDLVFRAIVSFASTQIPKYQGFIDRYDSIRYPGPGHSAEKPNMVKPALWAHRLHLTTQYEAKGSFSWYGWTIAFAAKNADGTDNQLASRLSARKDPNGAYLDPLYAAGREFWQMIAKGEAKVDYATAAEREPGDDEDEIPIK